MQNQVLVIDLIDESVDMTVAGTRDYIGSVRIPLKQVYQTGVIESTFNVVDENLRTNGQLQVKVEMFDKDSVTQIG